MRNRLITAAPWSKNPYFSSIITLFLERKLLEWLNEVSSVPLQQALRHLQTAFVSFFDKRAAYPGFKQKRNRQAAAYTYARLSL
jgi:putative transposase